MKKILGLTCAAMVWLMAAFLVAFPNLAINLKIHLLADSFIGGIDNELLYIPFLIVIDASIAFFLRPYVIRPILIGTSLFAILVYTIVCAITLEHEKVEGLFSDVLFVIAFISLLILRMVTFFPHVVRSENMVVEPIDVVLEAAEENQGAVASSDPQ